jgi:hypothetical protein
MPISVITNFSINDSVPFDTRLVATSSTSMANMLYKYAGLTTYRSDLGLNYTYNGSSWAVSSNGIYGGSGNLSSVNTTVGFGTVSTTLNAKSNYFTFKTYTDGFGDVHLDLENYFIRNTSGNSQYDVSYISQLMFNDDANHENYPGPYIMYNPKELFSSGRGGISFGTLNESQAYTVHERMRIDGNGIIRFKTNSTVDVTTKSVNIGIDSTNTRPFIGFNWKGSDVDTGTDASYVQFNDSVFSIHNFSSTTGTHSAIFSKGLVRINGGLEVTGGTISTNKNISFGAADGGVYFVSSNGNGIKYDDSPGKKYAALTFKPSTVPLDIITWNNTQISMNRNIMATSSTTLSIYSTINSFYKTQMWDNVFNPDYGVNAPGPVAAKNADDYSDLAFKRTGDAIENVKYDGDGGGAYENNIFVMPVGFAQGSPGDTVKTTGEFVIFIGANYNSSRTSESQVAKNTFSVGARDYDRIYYFYLDGYRLQIPHQVRWWLGEAGTTTNWIQIGNIETGNKNNNNRSSPSYGAVDYASRFYSQTVLVPAGVSFKIQFRFHVNFSISTASTESNSPRVFFNVIRSGKFRTLGYVAPTTASPIIGNLGYPGSPVDAEPTPGGG